MAFLGFGKKKNEDIKEPLTDPLGQQQKVAELPPLDSTLPEDNRGLPDTPTITSNNESTSSRDERLKRYTNPEYNDDGQQGFQQSSFSQSSFQQPTQQSAQQSFQEPKSSTSKDLELISSKLDYLKAAIDNMNQRIANLENLAKGEQQDRYKW